MLIQILQLLPLLSSQELPDLAFAANFAVAILKDCAWMHKMFKMVAVPEQNCFPFSRAAAMFVLNFLCMSAHGRSGGNGCDKSCKDKAQRGLFLVLMFVVIASIFCCHCPCKYTLCHIHGDLKMAKLKKAR